MGRAVVVFLDGASPDLLEAGVADGSLRVFSRLFERGRRARLESPDPYLPGVATETLIAGVGLAQHRRPYDLRLRPGTYMVETGSGAERPFAPFWRYVSDAGLWATVVSVESASLLGGFRGTQVVGWGDSTSGNRQPAFDPPEVRSWLEEVAPGRRTGSLHQVPLTRDDLVAYVHECRRAMTEQASATRMLLERTRWDLFVVSFDMLHEAGHLLWGVHEDPHPGELRDALPRLYGWMDEAIAGVVDAVPADARLLLVSTKGIRSATALPRAVDAFLCAGGWLVPNRGGLLRGGALRLAGLLRRGVRRATPLALRRSLARPVLPWRNRLDAGLTSPGVRWSMAESRAFSLPHADEAWMIRVNLAGRDPLGTIEPDTYDDACREIEAAARELLDGDTGTPVVRDVIRVDALLGADVRDVMPDLIVTFRDDRRIGSLHSPRSGRIAFEPDPRPFRTGTHREGGFMVATGDGVSATDPWPATIGVLDVAPTILRWLGVPIPAHMIGRPIDDLAR